MFDFGESFSANMNEKMKEVGELISFFSVMLLFGTFLIGIAQFLSERQITIGEVKLLSYNADYLSTLIYSGAFIVGGCLVGLIGLLLHILIYNTSLRDYIVNGFLMNAIFFILFGVLYFMQYMVIGKMWLIISVIIIVTIIAIIYYFYSILSRTY